MPKRKNDWKRKILGSILVCLVFAVLVFVYYVFVVMTWLPRVHLKNDYLALPVLIIFHILAFFLVWSFIQTTITDPGQVPIYWGFRVGDPDNRRRRYWLMCNLYKPERCHHCSACGRWILNMDHHWPWVNNCIGFWNRKYFMLLLNYVQITTVYVILTLSLDLVKSVIWIYEAIANTDKFHFHELQVAVFTIIVFLFVLLISTVMCFFYSFHRKLVRENKTTIENLENKSKDYQSKYDIDWYHNAWQVMGTKWYLWPFPIMPSFAKPKGEGIYFDKNVDSDEEDEGDDETPEDNQGAQREPVNLNRNGNQGESQNSGGAHNPSQGPPSGEPRGAQPGTGTGTGTVQTTKQGDRMTIHNEQANKWENLNNIVQADNTGQVYKSSGSDENKPAGVSLQDNSKYTNKIDPTTYEEMKNQYYKNTSNLAVETQPRRNKQTDERIDSKSSSGGLMRKSRAPEEGPSSRRTGYVSPGVKSKTKPKKSTGRPSQVKRTSAANKLRGGPGFR